MAEEFGSVVISDPRERLCNRVCANMLRELNYYATSEQKVIDILHDLNEVVQTDPEFVPQLAYYSREVLNIRSTSNFLIAYTATRAETKPFLRTYFNKSVRLPSDLIEIIGIAAALKPRGEEDTSAKLKIAKALQKAIQQKFPEFSIYQLGKYCSEGKRKRALLKKNAGVEERKKKDAGNESDEFHRGAHKFAVHPARSRSRSRSNSPPHSPGREEAKQITAKKPSISMKQVVKVCHLKEPALEIMSILGKRYPATEDDFVRSGLGQFKPFDITLANKRMKIPTPITWEAEVSARGNSAEIWENLVKSRKLPFMAMLRNLRNMIVTGVDDATHNINISRLTNTEQIANSRLFPFRFMSAYKEMNIDIERLQILHENRDFEASFIVKESENRRKATKAKKKYRVIRPVCVIGLETIERYKEAIETAIKIATSLNVNPIEGHSVIFCDVSGSMKTPLSKGSGLNSSVQCFQAGILLGLMVRSACNSVDFKIFSSRTRETEKCWLDVEANTQSILKDLEIVEEESKKLGGGTDFPFDYIEKITNERKHIDNMFIFSDMMIAPGKNEMKNGRGQEQYATQVTVTSVLEKYRATVNPNMRFVTVNLAGHGRKLTGVDFQNNFLNVEVSGYSDAILRLVSEMQKTQVVAVKEAARAIN